MNKLVYLYELDSTRISPWEIDNGRKALYEEIVGNCETRDARSQT